MADARDVIARAIATWPFGYSTEVADDVVSALAAAGLTITETPDWEWNVRDRDGVLMLIEGVSEEEARGWFTPRFRRTVVRRRPAGPWEVAP